MSEAAYRDVGQHEIVRSRSGFVLWVIEHHRISERAAKRVEDGLRHLQRAYTDEELLNGDLEALVLDFVAGLPPKRRETIGWSRCGQTYRRAVRDFRLYRAEVGT